MRRGKGTKRAVRGAALRRRPLGGPLLSRAVLRRGAVVLAWVGTFSAAAYGLHRLERYQRGLAAREPVRLKWVALPPWLEDPRQRAVLDEIAAQTGLNADADLFDPALVDQVGTRLARSPWVSRVARVSKQSDGIVWVDATFREPLTMVEARGMAYLVDEAGVRLPRQQRAAHLKPGDWIVVRNVGGRVPALGERWPGQDVAAGLKLASFLERARAAQRLTFGRCVLGVDVSDFDPRTGGGLKVITTNPRSYILWGLPPGQEYDVEPRAEAKLDALNQLYARQGGFPGDRPIDVRDKDYLRLLEPR